MNVIPEFSTFRVTSHVSLRKALDLVTPERIEEAIRLAHRTMQATGLAAPRIGARPGSIAQARCPPTRFSCGRAPGISMRW